MPRTCLRAVAALAVIAALPLSSCANSAPEKPAQSTASQTQNADPNAPESAAEAEATPEPAVTGSDLQLDDKAGGVSPEAGAFKLVTASIGEDWKTTCETLSDADVAELESYGGAECAAVLADVKQQGHLPLPAEFTDANTLTYTTTYLSDTTAKVAVSNGEQTLQTRWVKEGERWFGGYAG